MMDAIHIEMFEHMFEPTDDEDLCADSGEFVQAIMRAGFDSPVAAAGVTDSRFRLFLKIPGQPELTGVYYVSGWLDRGAVHLSWDDDQEHIVPRRREAILATRAKG